MDEELTGIMGEKWGLKGRRLNVHCNENAESAAQFLDLRQFTDPESLG